MFTVIETNPITVLTELSKKTSNSFEFIASEYLTGKYYLGTEALIESLSDPELSDKGFINYHKDIVFPNAFNKKDMKAKLIDVVVDCDDTLFLVYNVTTTHSGKQSIRAVRIPNYKDYESKLDEFVEEVHKKLFYPYETFGESVNPIFIDSIIPITYKKHFASVMLTELDTQMEDKDIYSLQKTPSGNQTARNILNRVLYKMKSIWSYQISEVLFQEMLNKYRTNENAHFSEDVASQLMSKLGEFMTEKNFVSGALVFKEKGPTPHDFCVRLYGCIDNDEKPDHADEYDESYGDYDCELITTYNCNLGIKEDFNYTVCEPMIYYPMVDETYDTEDNRYHKFIINLAKLYGYLNP